MIVTLIWLLKDARRGGLISIVYGFPGTAKSDLLAQVAVLMLVATEEKIMWTAHNNAPLISLTETLSNWIAPGTPLRAIILNVPARKKESSAKLALPTGTKGEAFHVTKLCDITEFGKSFSVTVEGPSMSALREGFTR